ncbi:hypothetical protein [Aquipuribacter hungaricus]|uniref:DUF3592 domain-containing protein n=1 Tax=Aquipuribacter hungaricus TaxID=545624 RepID=A0ABV7WBU4_9MICO
MTRAVRGSAASLKTLLLALVGSAVLFAVGLDMAAQEVAVHYKGQSADVVVIGEAEGSRGVPLLEARYVDDTIWPAPVSLDVPRDQPHALGDAIRVRYATGNPSLLRAEEESPLGGLALAAALMLPVLVVVTVLLPLQLVPHRRARQGHQQRVASEPL